MTNAEVIAKLQDKDPNEDAEITVVVSDDYGSHDSRVCVTVVEQCHIDNGEVTTAHIGDLCLFTCASSCE
jgi:hypothetical protein